MKLFISLLLIFSISFLSAQENSTIERIAAKHLAENQKKWALTKSDVSDFTISSHLRSAHNGITHIYVNQEIDGVSIHNAIAVINVKDDESLLYASSRFINDAKSKVQSKKSAALSPEDAIKTYCQYHELPLGQTIKKKHIPTTVKNEFIYDKTSFSEGNLYATLMYHQSDDGGLTLSWRVEINENTSPDFWVSFIDANSGEVLSNSNQTLSCYFHKDGFANQSRTCTHDHTQDHRSAISKNAIPSTSISIQDGSNYLVYPIPLENPLEGDQALVNEPFLPEASPFGWHDTDGIAGPEFTITRGNNVHAFLNTSGDGSSQGDEPDGGDALQFNFVHDMFGEPEENLESDVTQLFYSNNWAHDFSYFFGFDEAAGNFQQNNYGNPGSDDDFVNARALELEIDNGNPVTNNARFATPRDGQNGTMFVFPWVASDTELNMLSPQRREYIHGSAAFGLPDSSQRVVGTVAISVDTGGVDSLDACEPIINPEELAGKIAIVQRGQCDFSFKVNALEEAGAIGVIVCNRDEGIVTMAAGENAELVTIPSALLRKSDCDTIKAILENNVDVSLELVFTLPVPAVVSGSFDNGVVLHEYGHGISIRLTGGRTNSSCLNGDEQMGEGWSDFFTLVSSHQTGDRPEDERGLGIYLDRLTNSTTGIRRLPYSTDFTVNNQTYNDIRFTGFVLDGRRRGEHEVGEIWTGILWDMYWAFIGEYGFNVDFTDRQAGNSRAIQLIFDGMKIQGCNPGLVDGRDAILAADQALFNGENQCLIWDAFARRGVGFDAEQGSPFDREDNQEGFLTAPACQNALVITKEATEVIEAGDPIDVAVIVQNNTEQAIDNVTVSDVIPDGTSPVALDEFNATVDINTGEIFFDIGSLEPLEEIRIDYQLATSNESMSLINPNVDNVIQNFDPAPIFGEEEWIFELNGDIFDRLGNRVERADNWTIPGSLDVFDQSLVFGSLVDVTGGRPAVVFTHQFDTKLFFAGGDIEVSLDNGTEWTSVDADNIIVGGYTDEVAFKDADELGFTGFSDGRMTSIVDLSDYIGQTILIRLRYVSLIGEAVAQSSGASNGWTIFDIELIDLVDFNLNEACVSSSQMATVCDGAATIIEADNTSSTNDILKETFGFQVYPNPATNQIQLTVDGIDEQNSFLRLNRIDGSTISENALTNFGRRGLYSVPLPSLPAGVYIMELKSPEGRISEKLTIVN